MNSQQEIDNLEDYEDGPDRQRSESVDDFIRELEEKEKDLHITADLSIEIEDVDFDANIPDFIADEISANKNKPTKDMTPKQAPAPAADDKRLKDEIAALKRQIEDLKKERAQILEKSQARLKEFENFKKRLERERRETFVDQVCNLAKLMLPVMDNLERALVAAGDLPGEKNIEFSQFFDGIVLVNQQITDILERMGVQPVLSIGEQFDPHYHEAVEMTESDEYPQNTIVDELLRGYSIGDRIIRHSMVKVVSETSGRSSSDWSAEVADTAKANEQTEGSAALHEDFEELIASSYEDSPESPAKTK